MIKEHKEHNEHNERVEEMTKELLANLKSIGGGGSVTWDEEADRYRVEGSGMAIVNMAFACARTVIENRIGDPMAFVETIRFMVMTEGLRKHDAEEGSVN